MTNKVLLSMLAAGVTPVVAFAQTAAEKLTVDAFELDKNASATKELWLVAGTYTVAGTEGFTAQLSTDNKEFKDQIVIKELTKVYVKATNPNDKKKGTFNVQYTLDANQTATWTLMKERLVAAINQSNPTTAGTDKLHGAFTKASELSGRVNKVDKDWTEYKAFVDGSLEAELVTVEGMIGAAATNHECYTAAKSALTHYLAALNTTYKGIVAKPDATNDKALIDSYNKAATLIKGHYAVDNKGNESGKLEEAYKNNLAGIEYSGDTWEDLQTEIEGAIADLDAAHVNDVAWKTVNDAVTEAKNAQKEAVQKFIQLFQKEEDNGVYLDWLKEVQAELNDQYNRIYAVETANNSDGHRNAAAGIKNGNLDELTAAKTGVIDKIKSIESTWENKYKTQVAKLKGDLAIVKTLNDNLKAVNVGGIPQDIKDRIDAVQAEINKLEADIKGYDAAHTILTKDGDIEKVRAAIQKEISEKKDDKEVEGTLTYDAEPYIANYNANKNNLAAISVGDGSLQKALDNAKTAVGKLEYKYKDKDDKEQKYTIGNKFDNTVAELQGYIDILKESAEAAYNASSAKKEATKWMSATCEWFEEEEVSNADMIGMVGGIIADYQKAAEGAIDNYKAVFEALPKYDAAYKALAEKATLNAVPVLPEKTTTYGKEKTLLSGKIEEIRSTFNEALTLTDYDYSDKLAEAAAMLDDDIKNTCDNLVESYDKDKKAYDAYANEQAIKNLKASATTILTKTDTALKGLGLDDNKGNNLVGNSRADIDKEVAKLQAEWDRLDDMKESASDLEFLTTLNNDLNKLDQDIQALKDGAIKAAKEKVAANNAAKNAIDPLYAGVDKELNGTFDSKNNKWTYTALEDINKDNSRDAEFGATSKLVTGYDAELAAILGTINDSYDKEELLSKMESYKVGVYEGGEKVIDNKLMLLDGAGSLDPKKDIVEVVPGGEFYLYNVEAGGFFTGSNAYGTHAAVDPDASKALKVRFTPVGDGKYRLEDYGNSKGAKWMNTMAESQDAIYVDAAAQPGQETWTFQKQADGTFTIGNTLHTGKLLSAGANGSAGVPDLVFSDAADAKNKWVAVANANIGMSVTVGNNNTKDWESKEGGAYYEAYAGWDGLEMTDFHMGKNVVLPKGMYKLTIPAFYRQTGGYEDKTTSNAYIFAGDKKVKVLNIAGVGATNEGDAWGKIKSGACNNVIEFEVTEDNQIVKIGVEGTHDTMRSWFVIGGFTLEKAKEINVQKSLQEEIAGLKSRIVASRADAQASTDNYNAYNDVCTLRDHYGKTDKWAGESVATKITNAYNKIDDNEFTKVGNDQIQTAWGATGANLAYWQNYIKGATGSCNADLTKLNNDIAYSYNGKDKDNKPVHTMVADKAGYEQRIKDLVAKIELAVVDARAAEKSHNEQVALLNKVQDEWNKAYYDELLKKDESSHLTTDQNTMAEYQTQLIEIEDLIKKAWEKGNSHKDAYEIEVNKKKETVPGNQTDKLNTISSNIKKLLDTWKENYDSYIAADNAKRYADFETAVGTTSKTYTAAIETLRQYTKITSNALTEAIAEYQGAHDEIYDYATLIRELKAGAKASYDETASPECWDANEDSLATALRYESEIDTKLGAYTKKVNDTAFNQYKSLKNNAETLINNAYSNYTGQYRHWSLDKDGNNTSKTDAFKDIWNIINTANNAAGVDRNGNYTNKNCAVNIDQYISQLEGSKVMAMVEADKAAAAEAAWAAFTAYYDKKIAAERDSLENFYDNVGGDVLKNYDNMVANSYTAGCDELAQYLKDGYTLTEILASIENGIETAWNENIYKNAKLNASNNPENVKIYDEILDEVAKVQTEIDKLAAWTAGFKCDDQYSDGINNWQNQLDEVNVRGWLTIEMAKNYGYFARCSYIKDEFIDKLTNEKKVTSLINLISGDYPNAVDSEWKAVGKAIEALKAEYNKAAAENLDDETLDEYKDLIAELEEEHVSLGIDNAEGKYAEETNEKVKLEKTKADLVAMEADIVKYHEELASKYNDGKSAGEAIAELNTSLDAVKAENAAAVAAIEALHEPIVKKYTEDPVYVNSIGRYKTLADANTLISNLANDIDSIDAKIAEYGESQILTYLDNVKKHVAAAAADAKTISAIVAKFTELDNENEGRKVANDAALKAVEDALAEVVATIGGYSHVTVNDNDNQKYINYINDNITIQKNDYNVAYNNVWNSTLNNKWMLDDVANLLKDATYNEENRKLNGYQKPGLYQALRDAYNTYLNTNSNSYFGGVYVGNAYSEVNTRYWNISSAIKKADDYNLAIYNYGEYNYNVNGDRQHDENLNEMYVKADYMTEAVPAVDARIEELYAAIAEMAAYAEANSYMAGDVDHDHTVDVADFQKVVNFLLEKAKPTELELLAADVNGNERVDIADASGVINIIMDRKWNQPKSARARFATATDDALTVSAQDNGTTQRLAISLSGAYVGMQMDVQLPAGMTLASHSLGDAASEHEVFTNEINGAHRFVITSMKGAAIGSDDAMLYLDVNVSSDYDGSDVVISNIAASDAKLNLYTLSNVNAGQATGIHTVTMMEAAKNRIYNMGGQLMNSVKRGINIIVGEDGATKKVFNK